MRGLQSLFATSAGIALLGASVFADRAAIAQEFVPQGLAACTQDIGNSCADVKNGGGRIIKCLQTVPTVSATCKSALTPNDGPSGILTITVAITGVRSKTGVMIVLLADDPKKFPAGRRTVIVPPTGTVTVTFSRLKPGTYAVTAFHDENENGKFDIGSEGVARLGEALPAMSFEDAAVKITNDAKLTFSMLYF